MTSAQAPVGVCTRIPGRSSFAGTHASRPLPEPVLDGATATYREVMPGVDLAVAASVDGFSQALVVKSAQAADNPELATIDFGLQVDGLTLKQDPAAGNLTALNPAGQTVFATSTARMWDSSGTAESAATAPAAKSAAPTARSLAVPGTSPAPTDLTPGTNSSTVDIDVDSARQRLTLTPDQKLLDSPDTTYPVYIDPRMTGTRQAWTIAYKPHPNDSYWNGTGWSGGTTGEARVGYEQSTGGTARSFFRIDSKFLAGVKVVDAQFQITETHSWSCTAKPVELYLTGAISSATTWSNQPSWTVRQDSRNYAHGNESVGCPDKAVDFTAKDAAVKAAAGNWSDITFGLRAPQSAEDARDSNSWKKFKPDAQLIVEFNRAGKAPWALDTVPSTRVSSTDCGNRDTYMTLGNTDVTLNAQVWDPDGGDVNVQFLVWPTGKYDGSPGIIFDQRVRKTVLAGDPNGVRASIVVPKALLNQYKNASGGQFSWKAQTEDVNDSTFASDWTPTVGASGCRFGFDPTAPSTLPTVKSVNNLFPENAEGALAPTEGDFVLGSGGETDIAEYRWGLDRTPPGNVAKPATPGGDASIRVNLATPGPHTLYVQAFDAGKNAGPVYPYRFYAKSPGVMNQAGDVNSDGRPDMFAVDTSSNLTLYGGTGNGALAPRILLTENGSWSGALLTHRGTGPRTSTKTSSPGRPTVPSGSTPTAARGSSRRTPGSGSSSSRTRTPAWSWTRRRSSRSSRSATSRPTGRATTPISSRSSVTSSGSCPATPAATSRSATRSVPRGGASWRSARPATWTGTASWTSSPAAPPPASSGSTTARAEVTRTATVSPTAAPTRHRWESDPTRPSTRPAGPPPPGR